jgi:hypothetical protein
MVLSDFFRKRPLNDFFSGFISFSLSGRYQKYKAVFDLPLSGIMPRNALHGETSA